MTLRQERALKFQQEIERGRERAATNKRMAIIDRLCHQHPALLECCYVKVHHDNGGFVVVTARGDMGTTILTARGDTFPSESDFAQIILYCQSHGIPVPAEDTSNERDHTYRNQMQARSRWGDHHGRS